MIKMRFPAYGKMIRFVFLKCIFPVLLFIFLYPYAAFSALHVMPLGDSITYGLYGSYGGYRGYLFDRLISRSYDFYFVGGRSDNSPGTIDPFHEGHPGWRAERIRDNVYEFLIANPADLVLLHIGTNDISGIPDGLSESNWKSQVQAQVSEVSQILDTIDEFSENTVVMLALIISRTDEAQKTYTSYFNQRLRQMAEARTNDNVVVVDMELGAGLVYSTAGGGDLADYLHPNDNGYKKMANVWFSAIDSYDFSANCRLDSRFQTDYLEVAAKYYTDRDYVLTSVPAAYRGMEAIKTPNDDLSRTDAGSYLKFEMPYNGTVYVAYDGRAARLPNWLRSFAVTGDTINTSLSSQPYLQVYGKAFAAGDCVDLGGNKAAGFSGDTVSNYLVFYGVSGPPPGCVLDPKFDPVVLSAGTPYYTDRDYVLTAVPSAYAGMAAVTTPNDERDLTAPAGNYLTFEMPVDGAVYVAYDSRATSLPNWLRTFSYTGNTIQTSLSSQPYLKVYRKAFAVGDCVTLGANKAAGFAGGTVSNYLVFYGAGGSSGCVLDSAFGETTMKAGARFYTDRDYTITGGLPNWMIGRTLIQAPNDERFDASDSGYLRFTNPVDWWVYVLFDSRASSIPDWLKGWELREEKITTSLSSQPYLKVYRKQFAAGQCVDLGGNYGPGSSGETRSNFVVVYGK